MPARSRWAPPLSLVLLKVFPISQGVFPFQCRPRLALRGFQAWVLCKAALWQSCIVKSGIQIQLNWKKWNTFQCSCLISRFESFCAPRLWFLILPFISFCFCTFWLIGDRHWITNHLISFLTLHSRYPVLQSINTYYSLIGAVYVFKLCALFSLRILSPWLYQYYLHVFPISRNCLDPPHLPESPHRAFIPQCIYSPHCALVPCEFLLSTYLLSTYFILNFFSVISVIVLCCNFMFSPTTLLPLCMYTSIYVITLILTSACLITISALPH